jgi:hypothetical protein
VQTSPEDDSVSVVPAAIVPEVGAGAAAGAGVVLVGAGVVFGAVVFGAVVFGVVEVFVTVGGACVVALFAVSLSVSFALSLLLARARFAASAESFFSAVESVFDESPEQPTTVIAAIAKDVVVMRENFMWGPPTGDGNVPPSCQSGKGGLWVQTAVLSGLS